MIVVADLGRSLSSRQLAIWNRQHPTLTPEQCDVYRAQWQAEAATREATCPHRGDEIDTRTQKVEKKGCASCAKRGEEVPVYECALFGRCTIKPWQLGQKEAVCLTCQARLSPAPVPLDRRRIDPAKLLPAEFQFNNSIIRFEGRLLMAYRLNWSRATIVLAELDERYQPLRQWQLPLKQGTAQEDPRLWIYRGQLHVSYSAFRIRNGAMGTDIGYARLARREGEWLVESEHAPHYAQRDPQWEKNWGFFEHDGELLAVYSLSPHRILRIDGDQAELIAETPCDFDGKAGKLHGGAPPVLYQGEYYSWFHRRIGNTSEKIYTIDLYTFEARPPFRPCRQVVPPLLVPEKGDRPGPKVPHAIFPGGAFLEANRWNVSFGYYDKWSEAASWDVNRIEDALKPIASGPLGKLSYSESDFGLRVWKQVNLGNEYRLPDAMAGMTVVDVGMHIGSFSAACLERGAERVVSCEPITRSRAHAAKNLARFAGRFEIVPAYVVGRDDGTLQDQYGLPLLSLDPGATVRTLDSILADVLPREGLELHVASYGGSGCSFLGDYLHTKRRTITPQWNDAACLKHYWQPAALGIPRVCILAEPMAAYGSMIHRGIAGGVAHAITGDPTAAEVGVPTLVDAMYRFYEGWIESGEPLVFIKYEALWDQRGRLGAALGLDLSDMPQPLPRESRPLHVAALEPLAAKWRALPDFFVRGPVPKLPAIDLLKLDCEGPEHGIVEHADLSRVHRLCGEVHRIPGHDLSTFIATLERKGFHVEWERQGDGLWLFWATSPTAPALPASARPSLQPIEGTAKVKKKICDGFYVDLDLLKSMTAFTHKSEEGWGGFVRVKYHDGTEEHVRAGDEWHGDEAEAAKAARAKADEMIAAAEA